MISGEWTGESHYVKGSPADKDGQLFLNAAGATTPISVKPIEEQNEYESRRAWKAVADGIRKGERSSCFLGFRAEQRRSSLLARPLEDVTGNNR